MTLTKKQLQIALDKLNKSKPRIAVIGDLILDEYLIGYPERISREAPVLILEHKENYYRLGGAANAAINAAKLGADVTLIGTLGLDEAAERMQEICESNGIKLAALHLKDKPSTLKTRILSTNQASSLSHSGTSSTQQVLRIDRQSRKVLSDEQNKELLKIVNDRLQEFDLLLLSDYLLGIFSEEFSTKVIGLGLKAVVDPSGSFERFKGAHLITPNQPDTEKELGQEISFDSPSDLKKLNGLLQNKLSESSNFLITRGAEGMLLLEDSKAHLLPAFNKAEVFDVTGAGDTVSACISVALAAGLSLIEAVALGNLAASIVVRKAGSATTNTSEMKEALDKLSDLGHQVNEVEAKH